MSTELTRPTQNEREEYRVNYLMSGSVNVGNDIHKEIDLLLDLSPRENFEEKLKEWGFIVPEKYNLEKLPDEFQGQLIFDLIHYQSQSRRKILEKLEDKRIEEKKKFEENAKIIFFSLCFVIFIVAITTMTSS